MKIRLAGLTKESIVDGPGLRMVIFVQGCPHKCPGCHNPETHDFNGGTLADTKDIIALVRGAKLIRGVTFSGGEPFEQPESLAEIASFVRRQGLNIVTYTGYTFEEILNLGAKSAAKMELLRLTDLVIDGRYVEAERDLRLAFRGSRNQRIIDVPRSLASGKVVLSECELEN